MFRHPTGDQIPVGVGGGGARFSTPATGPTQPPAQWVPGLFPRDEAAGAWH